MKPKMSRRLVGYFMVVLVVFISFMTASFYVINQRAVFATYESNMRSQAQSMADTLSEIENQEQAMSGPGTGKNQNNNAAAGKRGYRSYLNYLSQISMYDVWVVDVQANHITMGRNGKEIAYDTVPADAANIIDEVFQGHVVESRSFSSLAGDAVLTVGAPVYDKNGEVLYAVLMHEHLSTLQESNMRMLWLLLGSSISAVLVAGFLSFWLSRRFVQPLRQMATATSRMAEGNFATRTHVHQSDEIGQLAVHIDNLSEQLGLAEQERALAEEHRRDFIAGISHELKTPVTVLRASLEGIHDEVFSDPEKIRSYTELMLSEARQLDRFISDLLELTNLQNPGFVIQKESVILYDVLMDAVRSQRQVAHQAGITVAVSCAAPPLVGLGDYSRLRQLFGVILSNAVKYSPRNSTVSVECAWDKPFFVVRISDTGVGMDKETLDHIFERFYRGAQRTPGVQGSGIGLAVAKEIADRHRATIGVTSEAGKGSCFTVRIPATAMSEPKMNGSEI